MKKQFFTLASLFIMGTIVNAQVGIGTPSPDATAMLDIVSTAKGLLMPRMSTIQRTGITTPATGLQVYDTTTNTFWYFNGTVWINAGAVPASTNIYNSDGTLTGPRSVNLGTNTLQFTAGAGSTGTAIRLNPAAAQQGFSQSGSGIFGIDSPGGVNGRFAVLENGNIGINWNAPTTTLQVRGNNRSFPATSGTTQGAGQVVRFMDNSTAVLDIGGNAASGYWFQATDLNNLAAAYPIMLNPNGGNIGIGTTTPSANLDIAGQQVRLTNTAGASFFKASNGTTDIRLQNNNGSGFVGALTAGTDFQVYAGGSPVITALAGGNVGIGTTTPSAKLELAGAVKIVDGTQAANKVLTSDANGLASWQTPPAATAAAGIVTITAAYTLSAGDLAKIILVNSAAAISITVPNTLPAGFYCEIIQKGNFKGTITAGTGVTINFASGTGAGTRVKNSAIGLIMESSTIGYVTGDSQ